MLLRLRCFAAAFSLAELVFLTPTLEAKELNLKRDGAFGFPQSEVKVLCENADLRVSVWSNATYLYVQAILWNDSDDTNRKGDDGRELCDSSTLLLDVDADQLRTPKIDRNYTLNPWPDKPGLYYSILINEHATTGLIPDSEGRGGIKYLETKDGRVRVDSFLIPLAEIDTQVGSPIRIAFYGTSTTPQFDLNSVGFTSEKTYYSHHLPLVNFHELTLHDGETIDTALVPDDRKPQPKVEKLAAQPQPTLTIGSVAPALDIEHWVQDGKGKYKPVSKFEAGKVYVVEFWATWCGPCIASMPHIAQLQNKYADQGVQVVSISDEELQTVQKFLERKIPASAKSDSETYDELTSQYCLTTDPDRSVHISYMQAAGRNGIPCAFIVGKDGVIEWIGHPMNIDKVIESVLANSWDRQAFLLEYQESEEFSQKTRAVVAFLNKNRFGPALELAIELEKGFESPKYKQSLKSLVSYVRASELNYKVLKKDPKAEQILREIGKVEVPNGINQVLWDSIVVPTLGGRRLNDQLVNVALELAEQNAKTEPENGYILDTLAHLQEMNGNIDAAIETQTKAVQFADERVRGEFSDYLKKLQMKK